MSSSSAVEQELVVARNSAQCEQLGVRQVAPIERILPNAKTVADRIEDEGASRTCAGYVRGVRFADGPRASLRIHGQAGIQGTPDAVTPLRRDGRTLVTIVFNHSGAICVS